MSDSSSSREFSFVLKLRGERLTASFQVSKMSHES